MKLKRKCLTILLLSILTMTFGYFRVKEAYAVTYEFETGFEETDPFGNWTEDPVEGYGYEIQTDIVYAGVNACRSDDTDGAMTYELASNYSAHYCLVHFYINGTVPEDYGGGIFVRIWDPEITVYIETNASRGAGKSPYIRFYDQMDDDFNVLDTQGLALETWHTLEIYTEGDSASANHKCWVNGRLIASVSDDTSGYNVTGVEVANYHWSGAYDGRVFVDDFASNDAIPMYYFNFNFYDLDSEDVQLYVDWELWNSTNNINYAESETSLYNGTYYLKTSKYGHLINTTTLDTLTYGNSTIDINLNMKRHQSCSNGFITSNDTISTIIVYAETPQLLNFTMEGIPPDQHSVGVAKNASYILKDGTNMTDWTYQSSPSHIYWDQPDGGAEGLLDSYSETNKDTNNILQRVHPSTVAQKSSYGQTFKSPSENKYKISSVKFYLRKYGTPTGHLIARLYAHTGTFGSTGKPTGSSLANSSSFSIGSLTTSYQLIEFTFSGTQQYTMGLDTPYCIQLEVSDGSLSTSKYIMVGSDGSSPSHEGNQALYCNSQWYYDGGYDTCFYLYGQEIKHNFAFVFPPTTDPVAGPHTPMNNRVKVTVRLNDEWLKGANVTVEGGPDNRLEWALTDVFGAVKFKVKTGSYDIVASYEQYRKVKPVYVSTHMTIGIDLTEEDIISPDLLPEDLEDLLAWVKLPELDLTTETLLVFILPLIVLVVYAVKKASEGPKRKWKYSYLK